MIISESASAYCADVTAGSRNEPTFSRRSGKSTPPCASLLLRLPEISFSNDCTISTRGRL